MYEIHEKDIAQALKEYDIPRHMKGYELIRSSIKYLLSCETIGRVNMCDVYGQLLCEGDNNAKVERNIRNAIKYAYNNRKIFDNHKFDKYRKCPGAKEFIFTLYYELIGE